MSDSIRKMYNDLSTADKQILREMIMKKFDLGEDAVYNRLRGFRTSFSFKESNIVCTWLELSESGKYKLKNNEEVCDLAGIPYPVI